MNNFITFGQNYNQMDTDNNFFSNQNFFKLFWAKKIIIFWIIVITGIISSIASFTIQKKYKSSVILFPAATNSLSKALLSQNTQRNQDILQLGEEEQSEQLIQIINSDEIRERIIKKYNLLNHYNIDTTGKYIRTMLQEEYDNNITCKRTEFMSIRIDVLDPNPDTAALIANHIADLIDTVFISMQKQRAQAALKIIENEFIDYKNYINNLEDSLTKLRYLGVQDPEAQSEVLTEQLAISISKGNQNAIKEIESKLNILAQYGGIYISIRNHLEHEKKEFTNIKMRYKEAKIDAESSIPHKFVVNKAYPSERAAYPIKWLIVLFSVLSTTIMTLFTIILIEKTKNN